MKLALAVALLFSVTSTFASDSWDNCYGNSGIFVIEHGYFYVQDSEADFNLGDKVKIIPIKKSIETCTVADTKEQAVSMEETITYEEYMIIDPFTDEPYKEGFICTRGAAALPVSLNCILGTEKVTDIYSK